MTGHADTELTPRVVTGVDYNLGTEHLPKNPDMRMCHCERAD